MLRTRRIPLLGAMALLAALVLWTMLGGGAPQTVTLSDGTRLTLYSVTAGTNGSFRTGNVLRRMADKLPSRWANKFGTQSFLETAALPETNLFLKIVSHGQKLENSLVSVRFQFVHESGGEDPRFMTLTRENLPTGGRAWLFHTSVWPRRSRTITVHPYLFGESIGERPASQGFRVKNPLYRDYPQWQAEVLPGRRAHGETIFILEGLVADRQTEQERRNRDPANGVLAQARLRVLTSGKPDSGWETCGAQFRDATGNRVQDVDRVKAKRGRNGEFSLPVSIPLLAGERAGKLGVALVPTQAIQENEIFWLRGLGARGTENSLRGSGSTNTPFGPVRANLMLRGSQPNEGMEAQLHIYRSAELKVDLAAPDVRRIVVLEAMDDQGRIYAPEVSPEYRLDIRRFRLPSDVKTLDVKVAIPRVVFVEYTVGRESIKPATGLRRE